MNRIYAEKEVVEKENAIKRLTKIHKRKTIDSDILEDKKIEVRGLENE